MVVGILIPIAILVVIIVIVVGVVLPTTSARTGTGEAFSGRLALRGYLRLASLVSSLIITFGLMSLFTAVLTIPAGRSFSYMLSVPRPPPGVVERQIPSEEEIKRQNEARADAQFKDDLVQGITLSLAGLVIWSLHSAGLRVVETPDERQNSWLNRLHRMGLLAIFGIGGLIAFPLAVYETVRYFVVASEYLFATPPGRGVAATLVFVPVWLYELWQVLRIYRRQRTAEMRRS